MKLTINGNYAVFNENITIKDLISRQFLRMEKIDFSIKVNNNKIALDDYHTNLHDGDSITIHVNGTKSLNLSFLKNNINKLQYVIKKLKFLIGFINIKIFIFNKFKPYLTLSTNNVSKYTFFTPNNTVLARSQHILSDEPDTIEWINSFSKDDVLLDIGANIGIYTIYAGQIGHKVISIEPLWSSYAVLCDNIILNDLTETIIPLNLALTDRRGIAKLSAPSIDAGKSHNSIDNSVFASLLVEEKLAMNIMGCTVDFIFKEFDLPSPNHIKIDVDGIEEKIIHGSNKLLSNNDSVRSILVEVSLLETNQCNNIIKSLSQLGFSLESSQRVKMTYIDIRKLDGLRGSGGMLNLIFTRNQR